MKKLVYHVKIAQENGAGFVKIPFELFSLQIPSVEGGLRVLNTSEVCVLAFLIQSKGEINLSVVAEKLHLSFQTVHRTLRKLEGAGLIERLA